MKKFLLSVFIIIVISNLFPADEDTITLIFEKSGSGVVYVEQSLYFDSKDVKNRKLMERIEKEYKINILNQFITLSSGTGFFITKDGDFITNHHVIDTSNLEKIKNNFLKLIDKDFLSKIPSNIISYSEYEELYEDFRSMILYSKFSYRIMIENKDIYTAELLKSDKDLDLALLKATGIQDAKALPLGDSDTLKVGNNVMAIGYPIPSTLFSFLKDFKSTTTTGSVSSIREDNWGIQHTSSINPGNSGGPLFNMKGEVIGINVGTVTGANNMFFSIPAKKLVKWLALVDMDTLVKRNQSEAKGIGTQYKVNDKGYLETGNMILVNLDPGYTIFIDGKNKGATPQLLKNLKEGEMTLRIENDKEYVEQKILVKKDITDVFTYVPRMNRFKGKLYIVSDPLKAEVYIDDKKAGITPLMINEILTGIHIVELKIDEYAIFKEEIIIIKNEMLEKKISLKKGYLIKFSEELPKDSVIEVTKDKQKYIYNYKEKVWLENGSWAVVITNSSLNKDIYQANINNSDIIVKVNLKYIESSVTLKNLQKNSKVILDEKDITVSIKNKSFKAAIGKHKLKIENENYQTIEQEIEIVKDKEITVELKYIRDYTKDLTSFKLSYKPAAIGLVIPGSIMLTIGIPLFVYSISNYFYQGYNIETRFPNYVSYYNERITTLSIFWVGIAFTSIGLAMDIASIPLFIINKTKEIKSSKKISLIIGVRDDFFLAASLDL